MNLSCHKGTTNNFTGTWNALGQQLTEEKVLKAVTTLAENKINITNFIIDDNWQSIDYCGHGQFQHGWVEFEAEREAFPHGLKHMVNLIREKHPSIQHVAVWHAILGYWGGLSAEGKLAKTYKTVEVVSSVKRPRWQIYILMNIGILCSCLKLCDSD